MKRFAFTRNIRFQLPLTYAGIAALAAVLIGAILILVIGNYYHGMELEYLAGNAEGIARNLTGFASRERIGPENTLEKNASFFQVQARATAFLIQSRVQILDQNNVLIADSGTPTQAWYIRLSEARPENRPEPTPGSGEPAPSISFSTAPLQVPPQRDPNAPFSGISTGRNMFGFTLQNPTIEEGNRSSLNTRVNFFDQYGDPLGVVVISEGPEYGRHILFNVIQGWGIAGLIAVLASALIGWLISRQISRPITVLEQVATEMKEGNLAVRAPTLKLAEMESLAQTFNQMANRIESNIHTLHHFVSDAAHELRTPLTALRADLDMALREKDEQKTRLLVTRSLEQLTRLEQLSKELLDLSRIETQSEKAGFERVDLRQLLLRTSEVHASAAEQAGMDFQMALPEGEMTVQGNEMQLERAVSNLLDNAVKFSAAGGWVKLTLSREEQSACIRVEDCGIGIPSEDRGMLFNRFHRGRNSHGYPGSGLGLAIARAIVEKHHGEIGIEPAEKTTRFFIRLPLA